jgi:hypothetical protein
MATSTFYADKDTGAVMISNITAGSPTYAQILASPQTYLSYIRFHSSLNFLTIKGAVSAASVTFPAFIRDTYTVSRDGGCLNSDDYYTTIAPTTKIQSVTIGTSPIINPAFCLLEYAGEIYADFYDGLTTASVDRRVFPVYNSADNTIRLLAVTTAVSADATSQTLTSVKVHVVNG